MDIKLTQKETMAMMFAADGLSSKEGAREMGLSISGYNHHIKSCLYKLGAKNRTHAVAMALRIKIIF